MNALGIIFSNIHDKNLQPLCTHRTVGSVPFAGRYRLIDFALSSMSASGITSIGVITKSHYRSLMNHLSSGKIWDLHRKYGGLTLLPPFSGNDSFVYRSRFDALCNIEDFLTSSNADTIIFSDCDCVYSLDFSSLIQSHKKNNASITIGYAEKIIEKGRSFVKIEEKNDKVSQMLPFSEGEGKLEKLYTNIFVLNKQFLLSLIEKKPQIKSFSNDVLFAKGRYNIFAKKLNGYFGFIDSISSYYKESMNLLNINNRNRLFNTSIKILTKPLDSEPFFLSKDSSTKNSCIADGCRVYGSVENSILFRNVTVKKGAKIKNSIIFQGSTIGENSTLNCTIVDKDATILTNRHLSGHTTHPQFISKKITI